MYISPNETNRMLLGLTMTCLASALGAWAGGVVATGNGVTLGLLTAAIAGWLSYVVVMSFTSRRGGVSVPLHLFWGLLPGGLAFLGCAFTLLSGHILLGAIAGLLGFPLLLWFLSSLPQSAPSSKLNKQDPITETRTDNQNQTPLM